MNKYVRARGASEYCDQEVFELVADIHYGTPFLVLLDCAKLYLDTRNTYQVNRFFGLQKSCISTAPQCNFRAKGASHQNLLS